MGRQLTLLLVKCDPENGLFIESFEQTQSLSGVLKLLSIIRYNTKRVNINKSPKLKKGPVCLKPEQSLN